MDTFLHDEELFYGTLQQLQTLIGLDSMLTNVVVVSPRVNLSRDRHSQPSRQGLGIVPPSASNTMSSHASASGSVAGRSATAATNKTNAARARDASKGISALIGIKSTLASVRVLATILKRHLDRITAKSNTKAQQQQNHDKDVPTVSQENQEAILDEATIATAKTSLLVGLGVGKGHGASTSCSNSSSNPNTQNQLLRAIIFALTQPELKIIRETIEGAFTESTTFTRNTNAMKHQECFALKSSEDNGLMDVLRKVCTLRRYISGNRSIGQSIN